MSDERDGWFSGSGDVERSSDLFVPNLVNLWAGEDKTFSLEVAREIKDLQVQILHNTNLCRVLVSVLKKWVTYPSEICKETGLDYGIVVNSVNTLLKSKVLFRIPMDPNELHPLIEHRIQNLWSLGIKGYPEFNRRMFVGLYREEFGGFFTIDWYRKLFSMIGLKTGEMLVAPEALHE